MMSGNQILVKSASNISSHIIIFLSSSTKKIILPIGKCCFKSEDISLAPQSATSSTISLKLWLCADHQK